MKCHLYSAAGNRILWLEALEADYDHLKASGFGLSRPYQLGQEMTAILGGSEHARYALFWNPDGTYEMVCGNAIRCLAHFICEGSASADVVSVRTPRTNYLSRKIDASYGSFVIPGRAIRVETQGLGGDILVEVGTPHRIRLVDHEWPDDDLLDAQCFSTATNPVNFNLVHRVARYRYRVRTFERGVGETSSCGTAAVSIVAALEARDAVAMEPHSSRIEFASGETLTVDYDVALEAYEVGGHVALLQDLSV